MTFLRRATIRKNLFPLIASAYVLLMLIGGGGTHLEPQFLATAAENSLEKLTFSGRVVNNKGASIADAEISYAVDWSATQFVARTVTDGTFRFEMTPPEPAKSAGRLDILITHPDYASRWRKLPFENTENIEIRLDAPGIISGRVMGGSGEPIPNAKAKIQFLMSGNPMSPQLEDYSTLDIFHRMPPAETDENGEFVFRNLPQSVMTMLYIQASGYAKDERFGVPVGAEGLQIRLKREGRIEGRLSYADTGAPVEDATVTANGIDLFHGRGNANVDENGVFAVKNLPPGLYDLYLGVGPEGWTAIPKGRILVAEGQTVSDVNLSLIQCGFITGRVTDAETGEPIANHNVFFHDDAHPESLGRRGSAATDSSGVYQIHAAPGQALVFASAPRNYEDIGKLSRSVNVVQGETVSVDFQFAKGIDLVIRTLTVAGEPVADAWITDQWGMDKLRSVKSDEKGEYIARGLRAGQLLLLNAEHLERGLRGMAEAEAQLGRAVEIRMKQYDQVKVSGRVVDQDGEPMPGVTIFLSQRSDQNTSTTGGPVASMTGANAAVTDSEGRYRGVRLMIGEKYIISASPYADGYFAAATAEFTATAEMTQIDDLTLLPGSTAGSASEQRATHQAERMYTEESEARLKALMGAPAPELKVGKWLSGLPISIGNLKEKTIALYFWDLGDSDNLLCIDVLNFLQKAYRKQGLVCVAVCPAAADTEKIERLIAEQSIIYPVALDRKTKIAGARGETFHRYAVGWGDPVILIDRKGEVANVAYPLNLQDRVQALLAD